MNKIQLENAIWDMHIHTCNCPKGNNEFSKLEKSEFISKIIEVFNKHSKLELFSFTDHNQISIDIYREYMDQNGQVNFLVGVEQDTYFDEDLEKNYKHLIIYFDINAENFTENLTFMNCYNSKIKGKPQKLHDLLSFLVEENIRFVLSPHAFKQDKRAINELWNDEDIVAREAHKYMDQFFCFWEAQGFSDISKAEEFLKEFELEDRVSIISFSDSNNFDKLNKYLENPCQWFSSLPTFKGLELVASDNSRISANKETIEINSFGNMIGKIVFNEQTIEFSDKMNCIIGGRGSGKSLLLDGIAAKIKDTPLDAKRKDYIDQFDYKIFNYAGDIIEKNNFSFDYYKQSYVASLFESNDYYDKIKEQFSEELDKIEDIETEKIKLQNKDIFDEMIFQNESLELDNISSLMGKYILLNDNTFKCSYKISERKNVNLIDYSKYYDLQDDVVKKLPKELRNDRELKDEITKLIMLVLKKIYDYNIELLSNDGIKSLAIDKYKNYKNSHDDDNKNKNTIEELFKNTFINKSNPYINRVNIINAYIKVMKNFKNHYENSLILNGEKDEAFMIKKVLNIQKPEDYLLSKLKDYFYINDLKNNHSDANVDLITAINYYCYETNKKLKDGKNIEDLDNELISFDLNYDSHPQILYKNEYGEYEDILYVSPGTQTNILMEYLVYKDSNKPILIDQPEDNVDNQTIYNKLRVWFRKLKNKRQVIVVTHDANIVINADSENIIIANHIDRDKFNYCYGALEFDKNLEIASNILDGGKEAVKRRLMKYGN